MKYILIPKENTTNPWVDEWDWMGLNDDDDAPNNSLISQESGE
jgi:hypothetical protein